MSGVPRARKSSHRPPRAADDGNEEQIKAGKPRTSHPGSQPRLIQSRAARVLRLVVPLGFLGLTFSFLRESFLSPGSSTEHASLAEGQVGQRGAITRRIAFGSCTSQLLSVSQAAWTTAVTSAQPDAWIWTGDMAYLDHPGIRCRDNGTTVVHPLCTCAQDWLHNTPASCQAGNLTHARERMEQQLQDPNYQQLVKFLCGTHMLKPGQQCPRPILGTWDDHDFNWRDGDGRLPNKEEHKSLFLDAIGVPLEDARRRQGRGLYTKRTFNEHIPGKQVDVFLLDQRFHRSPRWCPTRRAFCEHTLNKRARSKSKRTPEKLAFCRDFLGEEGAAFPHALPRLGRTAPQGSCCSADSALYMGWCRAHPLHSYLRTLSHSSLWSGNGVGAGHAPPSAKEVGRHAFMWQAACNASSDHFGAVPVGVQAHGPPLLRMKVRKKGQQEGSTICEVLGVRQRQWLRSSLLASPAPLKLLVSPSPLFNNPLPYVCGMRKKKRKKNKKSKSALGPLSDEEVSKFKGAEMTAGLGRIRGASMRSLKQASSLSPQLSLSSLSSPSSRPSLSCEGQVHGPSHFFGSGGRRLQASNATAEGDKEGDGLHLVKCRCMDDFDCYPAAQANLIHTIGQASGCVVVLTGDMHYSDFKVLDPRRASYLGHFYPVSGLRHPLLQVMASGLTTDTITLKARDCQGVARDRLQLRYGTGCSSVVSPAFGFIEVDWEHPRPRARVQIRDATRDNFVLLEVCISLDTCDLQSRCS